jgi:hypothetical protein
MPHAARLILTYYSALWRPAMSFASALGLRRKTPELNWLTHDDINNFLYLSSFEAVLLERRVLLPVGIPLVSDLLNRYLAPLPFFRLLTMINILVARTAPPKQRSEKRSVSVVVPARNEAETLRTLSCASRPWAPMTRSSSWRGAR